VSQPAGQRIRPRGEQPRAGVSVTQAADSTGELPVTPSSEQAAGDGGRRNRRKPRRARVYVTRLDPWSVAKAAFLLALAIGV